MELNSPICLSAPFFGLPLTVIVEHVLSTVKQDRLECRVTAGDVGAVG